MIHQRARRAFALILLTSVVLLFSLPACGNPFDCQAWGRGDCNPTRDAGTFQPDPCCQKDPEKPVNYLCFAYLNTPAFPNTACTVDVNDCWISLAAAETDALARAEALVPSSTPNILGVHCSLNNCQIPLKARRGLLEEQGFDAPLDLPVCGPTIDLIDGGSGPDSCISVTDPCSACINESCCSEYNACVAALGSADCDRMVGYWLGTGPGPEGVSSPALDAFNACATSNCGDVGTCTAYRSRPPDGGL